MKTLVILTMIIGSFSYAAGELKEDRAKVESSCQQEAKLAGCGDQKVGTGLLKCLHKYHKEHRKDSQFSEGCKSAMKELKQDRKEKKESKEENK